MSKFVVKTVASGVKFDLKAANGQTVASSEIYTSPAVCLKGVESVRKNAAAARVEDQTQEGWVPQRHPKFELYQDKAGQYRFRLKATNGKIIAISEGYVTRAACEHGIDSVKANAPQAEVVTE